MTFDGNNQFPTYEQYEQLIAVALRTAWETNICQAREALKSRESWILDKIFSAAERYDMDAEAILREAQIGEYATATLAVDPKRQKFHENFALEWIRKIHGVSTVRKPEQERLFLRETGMIVSANQYAQQGGKRPSNTKNIDFTWQFRGVQFLATHKYTKESGGSQDHQYEELERFVINGRDFSGQYEGKGTFLLALADGPYYFLDSDGQKLKALQEMCRQGNHIYALQTWQLEAWLNNQFPEQTDTKD